MATSDGISSADWSIVEEYAESIVDASLNDLDDTLLTSRLLKYLEKLESQYGRLPSILATRADYIENDQKELSLLKEAYVSACELGDKKNQAFISASLAEFYTEHRLGKEYTIYWCEMLKQNLSVFNDEYLCSVYNEISNELDGNV